MYILTQNFVICITFFPKLQRIDIAKNIHTYTIKYFIAFVFAIGAVRYYCQRYTHRVLPTIQMKLILLCVWAEQAVLVTAKTALKFKYEI